MWLTDDADALEELAAVGPDPTRGELCLERFLAALRASSRQV
jgi:hypothetical protein